VRALEKKQELNADPEKREGTLETTVNFSLNIDRCKKIIMDATEDDTSTSGGRIVLGVP